MAYASWLDQEIQDLVEIEEAFDTTDDAITYADIYEYFTQVDKRGRGKLGRKFLLKINIVILQHQKVELCQVCGTLIKKKANKQRHARLWHL